MTKKTGKALCPECLTGSWSYRENGHCPFCYQGTGMQLLACGFCHTTVDACALRKCCSFCDHTTEKTT